MLINVSRTTRVYIVRLILKQAVTCSSIRPLSKPLILRGLWGGLQPISWRWARRRGSHPGQVASVSHELREETGVHRETPHRHGGGTCKVHTPPQQPVSGLEPTTFLLWVVMSRWCNILTISFGSHFMMSHVLRSVQSYLSSTLSPPSPAQCCCPLVRAGGWHLTHTWWPCLRYCIHRVCGPRLSWHPLVREVNWNWTQYLL